MAHSGEIFVEEKAVFRLAEPLADVSSTGYIGKGRLEKSPEPLCLKVTKGADSDLLPLGQTRRQFFEAEYRLIQKMHNLGPQLAERRLARTQIVFVKTGQQGQVELQHYQAEQPTPPGSRIGLLMEDLGDLDIEKIIKAFEGNPQKYLLQLAEIFALASSAGIVMNDFKPEDYFIVNGELRRVDWNAQGETVDLAKAEAHNLKMYRNMVMSFKAIIPSGNFERCAEKLLGKVSTVENFTRLFGIWNDIFESPSQYVDPAITEREFLQGAITKISEVAPVDSPLGRAIIATATDNLSSTRSRFTLTSPSKYQESVLSEMLPSEDKGDQNLVIGLLAVRRMQLTIGEDQKQRIQISPAVMKETLNTEKRAAWDTDWLEFCLLRVKAEKGLLTQVELPTLQSHIGKLRGMFENHGNIEKLAVVLASLPPDVNGIAVDNVAIIKHILGYK